jgi:hypothetical protein
VFQMMDFDLGQHRSRTSQFLHHSACPNYLPPKQHLVKFLVTERAGLMHLPVEHVVALVGYRAFQYHPSEDFLHHMVLQVLRQIRMIQHTSSHY